jgi:beta-lactamase class A
VIAPPPPPVVADAATVFGEVAVRVGPRTDVLEMVVDGRVRVRLRLPPGPRRVSAPLPVGEHVVRARARGDGGVGMSPPAHLWVLPRSGARAGRIPGFVDARLQGDVAGLVREMPAVSGVYVQHLVTGCGAAVNAGARFPAASTLKAAILIEAVRRASGRPSPSTGRVLDQMIVESSDRAANAMLGTLGTGGASGPEAVTATLRAMGLAESLVRRPYIIEDALGRRRALTIDVTAQPALYTNFISTPFELARILVAIHRASLGRGALSRLGVSARAARVELMPRLLSVRDASKIVAGVPAGVPVMHKTGYTEEVKHDAGIVYLRKGPVVVVAMSWAAGGVGDATGDRFIAEVTRAAARRLGGGGRCGGPTLRTR